MPDTPSFIANHGLWGDDQRRQAAQVRARIEVEKPRFIRVAWVDPHGFARAKLLTRDAFVSALRNGHNILVATYTLDGAGARVFSSFTRGGGLGIEELTGSPNLIVVPDPSTFRMLPWDDRPDQGVGWVLCDTYFTNGKPFPFCPRQLLKRQLARLDERGWQLMVGLEVEWYLLKVATGLVEPDNIGGPGVRGRPIATMAAEPGFAIHSESGLDLMQPVLLELAAAYEKLGLPLRSVENEWGPGQVECTFAPQDALAAADTMLLFRTATRQLCRRLGHLATFMTRPAIKGYYPSGWHLHQSLVEAGSGRNVFMPDAGEAPLSGIGLMYTGGLLQHGVEGAVFANPTVNGYRRLRPNSLAPDRTTWAHDHRGVMVRALGGPGDPATRLENRMGEPAANPYLFIASQIVAGLDGIDRKLDPGPQDLESYIADRPMLPKSLAPALDALDASPLFREAFGATFLDYYLALKRTEAGRFASYLADNGMEPGDEPTEWEHNEYFDFF
ncbi:MAG: glutamine synthetase family protein [Hyphomicrobiaceae bacterium]